MLLLVRLGRKKYVWLGPGIYSSLFLILRRCCCEVLCLFWLLWDHEGEQVVWRKLLRYFTAFGFEWWDNLVSFQNFDALSRARPYLHLLLKSKQLSRQIECTNGRIRLVWLVLYDRKFVYLRRIPALHLVLFRQISIVRHFRSHALCINRLLLNGALSRLFLAHPELFDSHQTINLRSFRW